MKTYSHPHLWWCTEDKEIQSLTSIMTPQILRTIPQAASFGPQNKQEAIIFLYAEYCLTVEKYVLEIHKITTEGKTEKYKGLL